VFLVQNNGSYWHLTVCQDPNIDIVSGNRMLGFLQGKMCAEFSYEFPGDLHLLIAMAI